MSHLVIAYLPLAFIALVGLGLMVPLLRGSLPITHFLSIIGLFCFVFGVAFIAHDYFWKVRPADRTIAAICQSAKERHRVAPPSYSIRDIYNDSSWPCGLLCMEWQLTKWNDLRFLMAKSTFSASDRTISQQVQKIAAPIIEISLAPSSTPHCLKKLAKRPDVCIAATGRPAAEYDMSLRRSVSERQEGGVWVNTIEYVVFGRDDALLFSGETNRFTETNAYSSAFYYADVFSDRFACQDTPRVSDSHILQILLGPERNVAFQ